MTGRSTAVPRDAVLLQAVAAGARAERDEAFRALVERHRDRVYALCLRYFRDDDDAQDATQEAFLRVLRHAGGFRGESRVTTWLHRLTVNTCHDIARYRSRRPSTAVDDVGAVVDRIDPEPDPTTAVGTADAVRAALLQLDPETRELLLLCSVEGTPYAEVAAAYDIAVGTVKSRVHRARARLVDLLGDVLDDEPSPVDTRRAPPAPDDADHTAAEGRGPPGA